MNECWQCGHHITGAGCFKGDLTQFVRVNPKSTCNDWVSKTAPNTINAREDAYDNRLKGA